MISFIDYKKFENLRTFYRSEDTTQINISEIVKKTNQLQKEYFTITIPKLEERLQTLKKIKFQINQQYVISYILNVCNKIADSKLFVMYLTSTTIILYLACILRRLIYISPQTMILLGIACLLIFLVTIPADINRSNSYSKPELCERQGNIVNNCINITEAFLKAHLKIKEAIPECIPKNIGNIILGYSSSIEIEKTKESFYKRRLEDHIPQDLVSLTLEYV